MPQLGEIKKGSELGNRQSCRFIWHACIDCGKERWIRLDKFKSGKIIPHHMRCKACGSKIVGKGMRGELNKRWKGGKLTSNNGYFYRRIYPEDFFWPMASCWEPSGTAGRVLEHRLVMAKHLGRCLQGWEHVHHKNGIKSDNRIENLELTTAGAHCRAHSKGYRDGYRQGLIDGKNEYFKGLKV